VHAVRTILEEAGANLTAEVVLKPSLLLAPPEQIDRVFARSRVPAEERKDTPDSLMRALGKDLGSGYYSMVAALEKEKLISANGDCDQPVSTVVLLGGGTDGSGLTPRMLDVSLLHACAERGLRVAAAEALDTEETAIPVYRKGGIPITVDNVDQAAGRIALVLALAENQRGNYGFKSTANDVSPEMGE
jgi:hypothetical protein